ncbi:hypothetical protein [Sphingomonas oligoaromativorans]|uniref:hypothetical protein n=1 Tax=Sphingomonas oligoaromativorans TaxID=575322 RepID=UPI001422E0D8|nr:hypothetical protein [Sphingomonas oligoaromativorans]NIJ32098.1 hypothetical protein [Sphingomonas oligoaromativorans]
MQAKGWVRGIEPMFGDETAAGRLTGDGLRYAEDRGLDDIVEDSHHDDLAVDDAADERRLPASDRLVKLDHNQARDIEASISAVIDNLESTNGEPDDPSFRQRILGQLKAGRELLRAGEFKAYLLQVTLVSSLNELIRRYADSVIAGLATNLLQYVLTHGLSGQ